MDRPTRRVDFVAQYRKIAKEFRQIAINCEAWNNLHPEHTPMDVGNDLVRAQAAERIADAIDRGDPIPGEMYERLIAPLETIR